MEQRLFLYLDILGFTDIIKKASDVEGIYKIIDDLNVFMHKGSFECIVFSDTLLIYDTKPVSSDSREICRSIMWMCEFAQDLLYRSISF